MRRVDPLQKRLTAWGWEWSARLERECTLSVSIPCTLCLDGAGGTVPGHRVLMAPHDWLPRDVVETHRAIQRLPLRHQQVVASHYVEGHRPLKQRCGELGIAASTYYQRLDRALGSLRKLLRDVEKFHMERQHEIR